MPLLSAYLKRYARVRAKDNDSFNGEPTANERETVLMVESHIFSGRIPVKEREALFAHPPKM